MIKKAFTLAEVLITLAILGIIAALTLPNLQYNIQKQAMEKQTLKFYSQMYNAFAVNKAENATDSIYVEDTASFIRKNFNVAQICENRTDCFPEKYTTVNGSQTIRTNDILNSAQNSTYALADGTVFQLKDIDSGSSGITVVFDVNGKKSPNKLGYDLWIFTVFPDGSIDDANITPELRLDGTTTELKNKLASNFTECKAGNGEMLAYGNCFGHFMRNKFKFDY